MRKGEVGGRKGEEGRGKGGGGGEEVRSKRKREGKNEGTKKGLKGESISLEIHVICTEDVSENLFFFCQPTPSGKNLQYT